MAVIIPGYTGGNARWSTLQLQDFPFCFVLKNKKIPNPWNVDPRLKIIELDDFPENRFVVYNVRERMHVSTVPTTVQALWTTLRAILFTAWSETCI